MQASFLARVDGNDHRFYAQCMLLPAWHFRRIGRAATCVFLIGIMYIYFSITKMIRSPHLAQLRKNIDRAQANQHHRFQPIQMQSVSIKLQT